VLPNIIQDFQWGGIYSQGLRSRVSAVSELRGYAVTPVDVLSFKIHILFKNDLRSLNFGISPNRALLTATYVGGQNDIFHIILADG
jgi:hypothetical protein